MPFDALLGEAQDLLPPAVELRRRLHRHPELGLALPRTQDAILGALDGLGLELSTGEECSSVVGVLRGGAPGPTVLLRGDMDALPMPEDTGVDFASQVDGAMHACGHDTHVAMLAGAARLLAGRRDDLAGNVVFMFQPGEEGFAGAQVMLDEGLLAAAPSPLVKAFAIHITSKYRSGAIRLRGGTIMASADTFRVIVRGRGGHASAPHHALDPVPVACEIVTAIQTMVTRRIDVFDPAVVTVGRITAGTTDNVIPETAEILGTIRAVSESTRKRVHDGIRRVAEGVAAAHEGVAEVEVVLGYPVTVNDGGVAEETLALAGEVFGPDRVEAMPAPVMGAEDFSFVLQRVPGSMAFLGACLPELDPRTSAPNHSNRVMFHEDAMATGIALYGAVALRTLGAA